jgi:hypothetical protein
VGNEGKKIEIKQLKNTALYMVLRGRRVVV